MNIKHLTQVREFIIREQKHFAMRYGLAHDPECGTMFCIAGAAAVLFAADDPQVARVMSSTNNFYQSVPWPEVHRIAFQYLDPKDEKEMRRLDDLFLPDGRSLQDITLDEALDAIDRVISGERPWN